MTVYIVFGYCGKWSDRCDWPVHVFCDKARAEEHATSATRIAEEIYLWRDADDECWAYSDDPNKPQNAFDPEMGKHAVYSDVPRYYVKPAPMDDEP